MKSKLLGLGAVVLVFAGCASKGEREIASGSYDYLGASQQKVLEVPPELDKPNFSRRYELPELGENAPTELVGQKLKVLSPSLVLPLVAGSHVEEGSPDTKVLFDQINDDEPLETTIWNTVLDYLEKQNIGIASFDDNKRVLETEWVVDQIEGTSSWYDFTDSFVEVKRKFRFDLGIAPHGRTASLKTSLIDFIDESEGITIATVDPISKRVQEANFLNAIIQDYDFGIRLERDKRIAKIRQGFESNMGFNEDGEPAIVVDAVYENAWPRLLLVLRKMGFDVKDLDQSTGLLFVQYKGTEQSWWGSLFGANEDLEIEKNDYRLKVGSLGEKTSVTFMNEESSAFDTTLISEVFTPFKEYMSTEDLDI
ncbi:outer membrane protein assembly factor BamC [Glaciecola sp. MH2013]|uniref:outer membrane protein assembly factor BamC n=1 Tax=Glaciecola sp. MH2013 TaxID=2785524 RepID=UPI00189DADBD|nr:outer membrane protein assembly factor BamC [Glaciecola sp. MH2013]MBF7072870.1 outer membrane protein assembly factor BamC [Glaciecola sp. MH2013]